MAETETQGAPTVQQQGGPLPIAVPPAAFGATTAGESLQKAGQEAQGLSQQTMATAEKLQGLYNDAQVADKSISAADAGTKLIEQYKQLKMKAAVDAYPTITANVENVVKNGGEGLPLTARIQYMQQTRRMLFGQLAEAKSWAATQGNAYAEQGMISMVNAAGSAFVTAPNDVNEGLYHEQLGKYADWYARQNGLDMNKEEDKALVHQKTLEFTTNVYGPLVERQLVSEHLDAARAYYEAHRMDIDPKRQEIIDKAFASKESSNNTYTNALAAMSTTGGDVKVEGPGGAAAPGAAPPVPTGGDPALREKIIAEAKRQNVDPDYALRIAWQESHLNPNIGDSPKGAIGPFQLMPDTARGLGVNPRNTDENIRGGISYLKQNLGTFNNDQAMATAAYNAGPGAIQKAGGIPEGKGYDETRKYVQAVTGGLPGGGPPAQTVHMNPIPQLTATTDPAQWEADSMNIAFDNIARRFAGNAEEIVKQQTIVARELARLSEPQKLQIAATFDGAMALSIQKGYGDYTQFERENPTVWASLPGTYQHRLMSAIGQNGMISTPERQNNEAWADGLIHQMTDNPDALKGVNLDLLELTNGARRRLKDEVAGIQNHTWKPDSSAEAAVNSHDGQAVIDHLKAIDIGGLKPTSPGYAKAMANYDAHRLRFVGAMAQAITAWRNDPANKNTQLSDQVINSLISKVSAGILSPDKKTTRIAGAGFAIKPEDLAGVDAQLRHWHIPINEWSRGRLYEQMREEGRVT